MKPLRWTNTKDAHAYMAGRKKQNMQRAENNPNENWMLEKLLTTPFKWSRQAQWGYRLFDFWCSVLGVGIEVDGPEHNKDYDTYRDEYNFRRSGIVVIRVRNMNEDDAARALYLVNRVGTLVSRKEFLKINPNSKKGRRSLVNAPIERSLLSEYLESL